MPTVAPPAGPWDNRGVGPQVLGLVLAMLEVRSTVACPARDDVAARLEPLLPRQWALPADVVEIGAVQEHTMVRLVRQDGTTIAQRVLPADEPCAAQAQIAAVMIATWEGRLQAQRSDGALALPEPAAALIVPAPRPPPAPRWRGEVGAGPLAALGQGGIGIAAGLDAAAFAHASSWGVAVAVVGIGDHQVPFGGQPGATYSWRRLEVGLGPALTLCAARWSFALRGAAVGGLVDVRGAGFAVNQRTTSVDLGGAATLRLGYRIGAVTPWVGLTAIAWARDQAVRAAFVDGQESLPRYDALAGVGATWEAFL
jgi:hypothetical protein